jgi:probable phosphoglycerate mutase
MSRIILAKAGSTDYDEQNRIVGSLDLPLSPLGIAEADRISSDLRSVSLDTIYAAASEAAHATAQKIGEELDVKVKVLPDLKNQDFGCWQGLQFEEIKRKHPKVMRLWEETPASVCPPNGESVEMVLARVAKAIKPILKRHAGDTILLVAPDPLRAMIRSYLRNAPIGCPWNCEATLWEAIETATRPNSVAQELPPGAVR